MAVLTTHQILSFIQYKIATTHAAGEDICALLANPEVVFSLHVLDGNYNNWMLVPAMVVAANDIDYELEQQLEIVGMNTNEGLVQTTILLF